MNLADPVPENDVVRLDPMSPEHKDILLKSELAESMWRWMPVMSTGTSLEAYIDYCLAMKGSDTFYPFVVVEKETGEFAGFAAFEHVSRTHRRLEIGFVWHPEKYRSTAIAPATQLALLTRAHEARFRRISYFIPEQNERAIRAFSRIGAQKEGLIRNYMRTAGGTWTNMVVLGLVGDEIRAAISVLRDRVRQLHLA
jgi:N-acetyltransferase